MPKLGSLIGNVIGLATEANQTRKNNKATEAQRNANGSESTTRTPDPNERDLEYNQSWEHDWQLDDAAELAGSNTPRDTLVSFEDAVARLPPINPGAHLSLPVILPQRRPKDRSRGFVRAYAPVLNDVGIDQSTFLSFVETFDKASRSSPYLDVIFIGAVATGFVPSVSAQIAGEVIQVATKVAKQEQSRRRLNSFLDDANANLFAPRGLYCMIMAFKPESQKPISFGQVNVQDPFHSSSQQQAESGLQGFANKYKVSKGTTYGSLALPAAAPLVYPSLDVAMSNPDAENQPWFKQIGDILGGYRDKRAQATFAHQNPGSSISNKPQFASIYSDPNHPVNSGSLMALATGGAIKGTRDKTSRREERSRTSTRRASRRGQGSSSGESGQVSRQRGTLLGQGLSSVRGVLPQKEPGQRGGMIKRMMQEDVLYMLIVNQPTNQEVETAQAHLQHNIEGYSFQ